MRGGVSVWGEVQGTEVRVDGGQWGWGEGAWVSQIPSPWVRGDLGGRGGGGPM